MSAIGSTFPAMSQAPVNAPVMSQDMSKSNVDIVDLLSNLQKLSAEDQALISDIIACCAAETGMDAQSFSEHKSQGLLSIPTVGQGNCATPVFLRGNEESGCTVSLNGNCSESSFSSGSLFSKPFFSDSGSKQPSVDAAPADTPKGTASSLADLGNLWSYLPAPSVPSSSSPLSGMSCMMSPPPQALPGFAPVQSAACDGNSRAKRVGVSDEMKTSLMIRNVPKRYTQRSLIAEIVASGFEGLFDFFYLPTDISSGRNLGYAFINFLSPVVAKSFRDLFNKRQLRSQSTKTGLSISMAAVQGLQANLDNLLKNASVHRIKNPEYLPMVGVKAPDCERVTLLMPYQVRRPPLPSSALPAELLNLL